MGLSAVRPLGSTVQAGDPLLLVHAATPAAAEAARAAVRAAITIADTGVGKSLFAVQIAEAIVRGRSRLGPFETKVRPQRVLVLDFEMTHRQFHDRYTDGGAGPAATAKRHDFAPGILRAEISWQAGVPPQVDEGRGLQFLRHESSRPTDRGGEFR